MTAADPPAPGAAGPELVILVRPWRDVRAGGGCCSGGDASSVALQAPGATCERADGADHVRDTLGEVYAALRRDLPDADVQVVSAGNTAYLLPSTVRARGAEGWGPALRAAFRSTTPGAVLVAGRQVADLETMAADDVVRRVLDAVRPGHGPVRAPRA